MNHQQFLNKYQGTFQREPGIQSAECVALAKLYCKEVLGMTLGSFGGSAVKGWGNSSTFDPRYWKQVNNTPKGVPKQGDVVIWGTGIGINGHVAIINTANEGAFTCIEQNHTGKPGDVPGDEICVSQYTYKNVLGWYTPLFNLPIGDVNTGVIADISTQVNKLPELPKNTFKNVPNYNQTVNGHCTIFAAFGAVAYNTGKVFKNTRVLLEARTHCEPNQCTPKEACMIVAKNLGLKTITLKKEEAEKALDLGYALVVAIIAPTEMIVDGIRDGKIDGEYNVDISKSHALLLCKENKKYLINSLGKYVEKGLYNKYEISEEQFARIQKGSNFELIY